MTMKPKDELELESLKAGAFGVLADLIDHVSMNGLMSYAEGKRWVERAAFSDVFLVAIGRHFDESPEQPTTFPSLALVVFDLVDGWRDACDLRHSRNP
jgi:hypothetical protein